LAHLAILPISIAPFPSFYEEEKFLPMYGSSNSSVLESHKISKHAEFHDISLLVYKTDVFFCQL
jgi:hypothetical protein